MNVQFSFKGRQSLPYTTSKMLWVVYLTKGYPDDRRLSAKMHMDPRLCKEFDERNKESKRIW